MTVNSGAIINQSWRTKSCRPVRYASGMAKKSKSRWTQKPSCKCVKTELSIGRVIIRCDRHRGKPSKGRALCYWDEGQVQLEP